MAIPRLSLGRKEEATDPDVLRALVSELVSTFIFVFACQTSAVASGKLSPGQPTSGGLISIALSTSFAFFVSVSASFHISGGHVNPAISLGVFVSGSITFFRLLLYSAAQLLGSTLACLVLSIAVGLEVQRFEVSHVSQSGALVLEMVMTFALVYTLYATSIDPRKGEMGSVVVPLAMALMVGANALAGGPFTGASMNPALAFGPALVGWHWTDHWIHWCGPVVGAVSAALLYQILLISTPSHAPPHDAIYLSASDY